MPVQLEALDAKIAELKQATREANAALKDLRAERKARDAELDRSAAELTASIRDRIDASVAAGLGEYRGALTMAITRAEKSIYDRFDSFTALLLGEQVNEAVKARMQAAFEAARDDGGLDSKGRGHAGA